MSLLEIFAWIGIVFLAGLLGFAVLLLMPWDRWVPWLEEKLGEGPREGERRSDGPGRDQAREDRSEAERREPEEEEPDIEGAPDPNELHIDALEGIDWGSVTHVYGAAVDVPGQIRDLLSPRPATRKRAFWSLYSNIFHQGSRTKAAAVAIPAFYEILRLPSCWRAEVVDLLVHLAVGYPGEWTGLRPQLEALREHPVGEEVYAEVQEGLSGVEDLLGDEDRETRAWIAYLFSFFPRDAEERRARLRRRLEEEPDEWVRSVVFYALGFLGRYEVGSGAGPDELRALAFREIERGETDPTAVAAALTLAMDTDRPLPKPAFELVLEAAGLPDELVYRDLLLPPPARDLSANAEGALIRAVGEQRERALDHLEGRFRDAFGMQALRLAGIMLTLAFDPGWEESGRPSPEQARVVRAFLDHEPSPQGTEEQPWAAAVSDARGGPWWTGYANFTQLLRRHGLPMDPEELRRLVELEEV